VFISRCEDVSICRSDDVDELICQFVDFRCVDMSMDSCLDPLMCRCVGVSKDVCMAFCRCVDVRMCPFELISV